MNKQVIVAGAIAVALVAVAVSTIMVSTRKNHLELKGEVLKVRSRTQDPEHTIALLDLRLTNPSTQQFVVREVQVFIEEADGKSTAAEVFSDVDAKRVVDYYKTLGLMYNPTLVRKDKINAEQTADRTVTVSAPMADERLASRKGIRVVITDVDGTVAEVAEKRK